MATTLPAHDEILARLRATKIVPVIVINDPEDAVPLATALTEGGLACAEVTFRTKGAGEALRRICAENPDMLAGAGTVLTPQQAAEARAAGAHFVVAPGFNPAVVDYCQANGIPVYPGVCTPTDVEAALMKGLRTLKFFPAEPAGGVNFIKAISAPYNMVEFMPTGGISAANINSYLALKNVVACGGSWMAPNDWIAAKQFDRIKAATQQAVETVKAAEL